MLDYVIIYLNTKISNNTEAIKVDIRLFKINRLSTDSHFLIYIFKKYTTQFCLCGQFKINLCGLKYSKIHILYTINYE